MSFLLVCLPFRTMWVVPHQLQCVISFSWFDDMHKIKWPVYMQYRTNIGSLGSLLLPRRVVRRCTLAENSLF